MSSIMGLSNLPNNNNSNTPNIIQYQPNTRVNTTPQKGGIYERGSFR